MGKNIKTGLLVLALLAGLLLLLTMFKSSPANTPVPSAAVEASPLELHDNDITAIDYTARGTTYTITRQYDADGESTVALSPQRTGFAYDSELLLASFEAASSLEGCTLLAQNVPDDKLADYGFDAPTLTWTLHDGDGDSATLELGNKSGDGYGVYIREASKNAVFILPYLVAQQFAKGEFELRTLQFMPPETAGDLSGRLQTCTLRGTNGSFTLQRLPDVHSATGNAFAVTAPTRWLAGNYMLSLELLTPLSSLNFDGIAEDDPADLARYGLDDPYMLSLTDVDGWSATLLIGDTIATGGRYVMQQGLPTVFIDLGGDYTFLDIQCADLAETQLWKAQLTQAAALEYALNGQTNTLRCQLTDGALTTTLNDKQLSYNDANALFEQTMNLTTEPTEKPLSGTAAGTIKLTLTDGTTHTLQLLSSTGGYYGVAMDGEPLCHRLAVTQIDALLTAIHTTKEG